MDVPFIEIDAEKKWYYSKDPMAQISGPRGSGKTYFIYYLLLSTAEIGADIYILDPKRSDLSSLRFCYPERFRNNRVATTPPQICKILREVCELMNKRYEQYFEVESSNLGDDYLSLGLQPIFVFFDEVLAMVEEDSKLGKEAEKYLKQIILKGRQSGIYAIISSQRLSADAMSTVIRENAGMRVVLGKVQPESYRMGLGESFKNLPSARKGVGQGYIYLDGQGWETPRAFTAPYLDMYKINFRQLFRNMIEKNLDL